MRLALEYASQPIARVLRVPDLNLLLFQRPGSTAPAPWRRVCQSQKYPLCFNGGIGIAKTGKPVEIGEFSPFPRKRQSHLQHAELANLFLGLGKPPERGVPYH